MATTYIGQAYVETKTKIDTAETNISQKISDISASTVQPSQATLLSLQYEMQLFSFFTEFISTFNKKVAEAFDNDIRKQDKNPSGATDCCALFLTLLCCELCGA